MSLSRFLSSTSAAAAALGVGSVGAGCSDDSCGTGGAPKAGLVASAEMVTLTYGDLSALAGNDCPAPGTPDGVISLSLEGKQTDGTGLITICIPRPDLLNDGMRTLGTAISSADVRFIDLQGMSNGCTFAIDSTRPPTGMGGSTGLCANGTSSAGFALEIDGALSLKRTCGAVMDTVSVTVRGKVAVAKRPGS